MLRSHFLELIRIFTLDSNLRLFYHREQLCLGMMLL